MLVEDQNLDFLAQEDQSLDLIPLGDLSLESLDLKDLDLKAPIIPKTLEEGMIDLVIIIVDILDLVADLPNTPEEILVMFPSNTRE